MEGGKDTRVTTLSRRLLALVTMAASALTYAQQPLIQHVEPVQITARPGLAEFDAYGRRFSLELKTNDRLLAKLPARRKAEISGIQVLRGRLAGQPGSWVRLTAFGGRVEGAIWDGTDLYAVGRYADVADALTTPMPVSQDQTVVFRLSDALNIFPQNFCAVAQSAGRAAADSSALEQYKSMVGELQMQALSVPVTKQMDIALIADGAFQATESPDVSGSLLARLNVADGIFADQVGLLLNAAQIQLVPADNDPFTTGDPEALLDQVSVYRAATPAVRSQAIAHLVTGKSLTGTTLGIARIGGVCSVDNGVSLSDGRLGSFFSGLIMTHEIGHNLGAEHDGDAAGACGGVGPGYIMWPSLDSSVRQFSQCSVSTMQQKISGSLCLTSASVADATVTLTPSVTTAELQTPMTLTATVTSAGANLVQGAHITFSIPATVNATSISASAGTCTLTPTPNCVLGDIPSGEQRTVTITVTPVAETPQVLVTTELTAANDRVLNNNTAFTEFAVVNNADASVSVLPGSASVRTGDPVDYMITIRSIRSAVVRNARIDLSPGGLNQVTYTPSVGTCTIFGSCQFGDLQPGATVTLAVHGVATSAGTYQHSIRLDTQNESGNNNFATFDLTIGASTNVSITGMAIATINVGATHTSEFVIRNTGGVRTATNVGVRLTSDFWAPIQTAVVTGGTCVVDSGYLANCQLGDMPVDDIRTVTVTVLAVDTHFSQLSGRVSADVDDKYIDNDATNGLQIRNPVDLGVFSIGGTSRVESREATDHVPIYSESTMAATDFVATVELPDSVRLTALALSGTACEIIDPRHGRCTAASLVHQMSRELLITAIGDAPGVYPVRVTISATGDADTSDNSAEYNVQVTPFADAGVTPINVPQYVFLGQVYQFETRLRTSYRDVPNVNFMVTYPVSVSITAPADLTGCVTERSVDNRYDTLLCLMALVPANTDRLLQFQLRGVSAGDGGRVTAQAWTSYDVNWDNNASDVPVQVVEDSDVAVELAGTSATAKVGTSLALPRITLRSTQATYDITLKVPIPAFASIKSVSSGWVCTGTTTLECGPVVLMPGTETSFDITLDTQQAGTFTSKVEVTAVNDTNAANNTADIAVTVNAIATPPSSPPAGSGGSGGGGGGRIDWLTALLLGLLLAHRAAKQSKSACSS